MAACDIDDASMKSDLTNYIHIAENFIGRCEQIQIPGASKLRKKCLSELKFLQTLHCKPSKVETHLSSSNLVHFASILHAVETFPKVTHILKPVMFPGHDSLPVDVIACEGHLWVKAIARKGQALHLVWAGQGQFGEKTLLRQAEDYLHLATLHPVHFKTPKVCYAFYNEVTRPMAEALSDLGVIVCGEKVDVSEEIKTKLSSVYDLDQSSDSDRDFRFDTDHKGNPNLSKEIIDCGISVICSSSNLEAVMPQETPFSSYTQKCAQGLNIPERLETLLKGNTSADSTENEPSTSDFFVSQITSSGKTDTNTTEKLTNFRKYYFFDSDVLMTDMNMFQTHVISQSESSEHGHQVVLDTQPIKRVNLDVTALIALISAITHGRCHFMFQEPVLSEQATEERRFPILPKLKEFLKGKELFVCETAMAAFTSILETLGGVEEKKRATELLNIVTVVPDQPSVRTQKLPISAKIKHRSKMIFGTGDELQMITLTANSGFFRAAKNQGVSFSVHLHAARALTEQKETTARKLDTDTGEAL